MAEYKNELEKDNRIILFPDVQILRDEIEKLRTELSMLVLERDELKFIICKNIETEYMIRIGSLEYKAYEAQCASMRLKRKIELIQAKKNRQEKINLNKIDEILEEEFYEYLQKLNKQIDKMNEVLKHNKSEFLSEEESGELKKLYRKIVKILHPDINPEVTMSQIKMLDNAVIAYKNGDLGTLKIINEMIGEPQMPEKHGDAFSQLKVEKERLNEFLNTVRNNIDKIKSEYPYTVKEILEDEQRLEQKKLELEDVLKQYKELNKAYNIKIKEMLR